MADKPLGATHHAAGSRQAVYYKFDGHVWKWWNPAGFVWERCVDNKPAHEVTPLPPSEQSLCCGTTCDKRNVDEYIAKLEAVAEAARMVAYGVLAHDMNGHSLRTMLEALPHD